MLSDPSIENTVEVIDLLESPTMEKETKLKRKIKPIMNASKRETVKELANGVDRPRSFSDLSNSKSPVDQSLFVFVDCLLKNIFGISSDEIIIDKECETKKNHELILNSWEFVEWNLNVPKRVMNTQKLVRQTFKYIIDFLNAKYQFEQPVEFIPQKISVREGDRVISIVNVLIKFV